ncbi:MAG: Uma2 family endonuclease [Gemmataceae bacterium]
MTATLTRPPTPAPAVVPRPYRLSVPQFHAMIDAGVFGSEGRVELLEGLLVDRADMNTPHAIGQELAADELRARLPAGWHVRGEKPVTLPTSEPFPDVAVARGARRDYHPDHPTPADIALLVEVADSSLATDRGWKRRIYAEARVAVYWVVNLIDREVEVHTGPHGSGDAADYADARTYRHGDAVPLSVGGVDLPPVPVADLLP